MCYSQSLSVSLALASWVAVAWLTRTKRTDGQRAVPPYLGPIAFYAIMETQTSRTRRAPTMWLPRCGLVRPQRCLRRPSACRSCGPYSLACACCRLTFCRHRAGTYSVLRNDEIMVGPQVCTRTGPSHLTWTLPYQSKNGLEANLFPYLLLWFYPALYEPQGAVRCACWIAQVLVVVFTAGSIHELPTTWCALSVPIILTGICVDVCDAVHLPQRLALRYRSWRRSLAPRIALWRATTRPDRAGLVVCAGQKRPLQNVCKK